MKLLIMRGVAPTILLILVVASMAFAGAAARGSKIALPTVAFAEVPLYPPLARVARIEGVVHVKVTTDGHRVIGAEAQDGHRLLAAAAEKNARTWEFATHEPMAFTVTYRYKLATRAEGNPNNPVVTLRLPTDVEVATSPVIISDPPAEVR